MPGFTEHLSAGSRALSDDLYALLEFFLKSHCYPRYRTHDGPEKSSIAGNPIIVPRETEPEFLA